MYTVPINNRPKKPPFSSHSLLTLLCKSSGIISIFCAISLTVWLMSVNNDLNYRNMFVLLIFCWRIVWKTLLFTLLSWGIIALGVSRNPHILLKKTAFGMYGLILLIGIGFSAGFFILDNDPPRYIGTVLLPMALQLLMLIIAPYRYFDVR
ncbi:MAG: hypothetical protein LCH85_19015 [Chloroflexi bacterium]|nr:hypothetical protein [Chloroflexota bacterium]